MNTSPAVTKVVLQFDNGDPYSIDMQAFNAFWRKDGDIYICLFASFIFFYEPVSYSFTPQTRTFEYKYSPSLLQLDGDEPSPGIFSSQTGRLVVSGLYGLYGCDIHRIFRDGPNDRLCRKVLPRGIDCYGMDPYGGAILWMEKRLFQSKSGEVSISYFD
ncbi:hypothetical protein DFH11DRAFT_1086452 [Phellopilus nigrolimitatus]|nr:hypothetical protein DFH11DRAFT_1086452 [Phellopilus nigrolimitatus]